MASTITHRQTGVHVKAYTLKKNGDTEEFHLFEGDMKEGGCTSGTKSICKKMDHANGGNVFACKTEVEARIKSAESGRKVCGVCVSHLYTTYP